MRKRHRRSLQIACSIRNVLIAATFQLACNSDTGVGSPQRAQSSALPESLSDRSPCFDHPMTIEGRVGGPLPAAPIDRDAYLMGGMPNDAVSVQQIFELAKRYQRVCVGDLETWEGGEIYVEVHLEFHPDDERYLSRLFVGYMGRPAGSLPRINDHADVFFVAPSPEWLGSTLVSDVEHITGRGAHTYLLVERYRAEDLVGALRREPTFEVDVLETRKLDEFHRPIFVLQGDVRVPLSTAHFVYDNDPAFQDWATLVLVSRRRSTACP